MKSKGKIPISQHPKRQKITTKQKDSIFTLSNELPQELITEILLRLEVKPLLKFRCVSKSWLSLISSSEFAKTHVLLSSENKNYTHHRVISQAIHNVMECSLSRLVNDNVVEAYGLDYPGKFDNCNPWIVGSANGLICLAIGEHVGIRYTLHSMFLWNPSIRKYRKLPSCWPKGIFPNIYVYPPDVAVYNFGFAYDELRDDYKIVGIFPVYRYSRLLHIEVKIYSLKCDSWRHIDDFHGRGMMLDVRKGSVSKFLNGKLHWVDTGMNIVSFDLADERWGEVDQPLCFGRCVFLLLGVWRSELYACCNYSHETNIWVMKEYGVKESWTMIFTDKPDDAIVGRVRRVSYDDIFPPVLTLNEEVLFRHKSYFLKYNPEDGSITYISAANLGSCCESEIYVKSLVWPFLLEGP